MTAAEYTYQQDQAPLDAIATKIVAASAKSAAGRNGFFDTEVFPLRHTLIVYWHGAVPTAVVRAIASAPHSAQVRMVKTQYSLATLTQQMKLVNSHEFP